MRGFLAFDDKDQKLFMEDLSKIIERWNRETGVSKQIKEYPELSLEMYQRTLNIDLIGI